MESECFPPPPPPPDTSADRKEEEMAVYRTKVIQFLGRNTPIILQNDNGPCPLLAICNILSLKNSLSLSTEIPEVSQEKLLGLVAERLIDGNTNVKDDAYAENQQQNIADAIDLLPRLTTGIDVNIKFRRIDDFEFTRECAIFDLLDIPLYHGWIVDPQDIETAGAIGSKSYNTLMGDLVALETQEMDNESKNNIEDDTVDFVAATTAALGVPSPSLSRGQSFNESPHKERKGDIEEEAELLQALKLSEEDKSISSTVGIIVDDAKSKESACVNKSEPVTLSEAVKSEITNSEPVTLSEAVKSEITNSEPVTLSEAVRSEITNAEPVTLISDDTSARVTNSESLTLPVRSEITNDKILSFDDTNGVTTDHANHETIVGKTASDVKIEDKRGQTPVFEQEPVSTSSSILDELRTDKLTENDSKPTSELVEPGNVQNGCEGRDLSGLLASTTDSDLSSAQIHKIDKPESHTASVDSSEPLYEGEECILESAISAGYENKEPVYEGEVLLAEQVDRDCKIDGSFNSKAGLSTREGELIKTFMKSSASQLTIYGLFCLQDKVKERELCVFFRNNHFNTMFKYEGELYILATDQGYLNQPDLVWEKLNEVNGDTVFMTGKFKEFKVDDDQTNSSWDEQSAMTNTADYLANIDSQEQSSFSSDLQLAMALQQQEFDQQQQQTQQSQQQRTAQEPAVSGSSRLVTGPQVHRPRPAPPSSKQESKSKEKCTIM